jgi:hypothetical protein
MDHKAVGGVSAQIQQLKKVTYPARVPELEENQAN